VRAVLAQLGVADKPTVVALNKIDALGGEVPADIRAALELPEDDVPISAQTGEGLDALLVRVEALLKEQMTTVTVCIPYDRGDLVDRFHRHGQVESIEYGADGVTLRGRVPRRVAARLAQYQRA
jgi:GTP-binding protein HflX